MRESALLMKLAPALGMRRPRRRRGRVYRLTTDSIASSTVVVVTTLRPDLLPQRALKCLRTTTGVFSDQDLEPPYMFFTPRPQPLLLLGEIKTAIKRSCWKEPGAL